MTINAFYATSSKRLLQIFFLSTYNVYILVSYQLQLNAVQFNVKSVNELKTQIFR